jgi:hypothetical protein
MSGAIFGFTQITQLTKSRRRPQGQLNDYLFVPCEASTQHLIECKEKSSSDVGRYEERENGGSPIFFEAHSQFQLIDNKKKQELWYVCPTSILSTCMETPGGEHIPEYYLPGPSSQPSRLKILQFL